MDLLQDLTRKKLCINPFLLHSNYKKSKSSDQFLSDADLARLQNHSMFNKQMKICVSCRRHGRQFPNAPIRYIDEIMEIEDSAEENVVQPSTSRQAQVKADQRLTQLSQSSESPIANSYQNCHSTDRNFINREHKRRFNWS